MSDVLLLLRMPSMVNKDEYIILTEKERETMLREARPCFASGFRYIAAAFSAAATAVKERKKRFEGKPLRAFNDAKKEINRESIMSPKDQDGWPESFFFLLSRTTHISEKGGTRREKKRVEDKRC